MQKHHFERLPHIHADSSKCNALPPIGISSIDTTNDTVEQKEDSQNMKIHLPLSTEELIDGQKNDTFCVSILKSISNKKVSMDKDFKKIKDSCTKL